MELDKSGIYQLPRFLFLQSAHASYMSVCHGNQTTLHVTYALQWQYTAITLTKLIFLYKTSNAVSLALSHTHRDNYEFVAMRCKLHAVNQGCQKRNHASSRSDAENEIMQVRDPMHISR